MTAHALRLLAVAALVLAGCEAEAPAPEAPAAPDASEAPAAPPAEAPADAEATVEAMEGEWRSLEDPLSTMTIEGDRVVEVYDGQADAPRTIRAVAACDDLTDAPTSRTFVIEEAEGEPRCFELEGVTEDALSYTYMARGNTLAFERVGE